MKFNCAFTLSGKEIGDITCNKCKNVVSLGRDLMRQRMMTDILEMQCPACQTQYFDPQNDGALGMPWPIVSELVRRRVKLSREQKGVVEGIAEAILNDLTRTDEIDLAELGRLLGEQYSAQGLPAPTVVHCASPRDYLRKAIAARTPSGTLEDVIPLSEGAMHYKWGLLGERLCFEYGEAIRLSEAYDPLWGAVGDVLDRLLIKARHLSSAVTDRLSREYFHGKSINAEFYLAFSSQGLGDEADHMAKTEALWRLGEIGSNGEIERIRKILGACWQVHPFEKYCFVCERPARVFHPGVDKKLADRVVTVVFRDGEQYTLDLKETTY